MNKDEEEYADKCIKHMSDYADKTQQTIMLIMELAQQELTSAQYEQ
jgi:hypothetical protein